LGLRRRIRAHDQQAIDLQQAVYAALRKRDGAMVVGEGAPARWSSPWPQTNPGRYQRLRYFHGMRPSFWALAKAAADRITPSDCASKY
jgi:hypothetical protein